MRLTKAKTGAPIVVRRLPEYPDAEREIHAVGLLPGGLIRIIRRAPFWGPLLLETEGRTVALGWKVARSVDVVLATDPRAELAPDDR
jgi:Fe2+ transport system protein FeoA